LAELKRINQYEPYFDETEIDGLKEVIESTWVLEHTRTREFEAKLADYIGSKYAVATVNGTIAISLALMAMGVSSGDEVITTD